MPIGFRWQSKLARMAVLIIESPLYVSGDVRMMGANGIKLINIHLTVFQGKMF